MKKRGFFSKKGSLVYATIVSVACVFSAGISTFAWFQAEANVRVASTSSSTTISVSAPDAVVVANPTLYAFRGNGSHGYKGDTPNHSFSIGDGATQYYEVTGASISISGLWPGYKATFCIKTSASNSGVVRTGSLKLVSYTQTNKSTRKILNNDKTAVTEKNIEIENAINIYVGINGTGAYGVGSDAFAYAGSSLANTYLLQNAEVNDDDVYCFYTIEFSSASSTYYTEYVLNESVYSVALEAQSDSGDRFFAADETNGSSSCYEGLSFNVTSLTLEVC